MMLHVTLKNLAPVVPGDQVQYCEFLGHQLLQLVQFEVNHNILDKYDPNLYNFHYQFFVPPNKQIAYKKNVGQEVPVPAYLTQNPVVDGYREQKFILNGPQTPQASIPSVEMWIPLLFWFNVDPRLSIPSVAIPYGQRFITVTLANVSQIAFGIDNGGGGAFIPPTLDTFELYTNNIFVNPEIHDIFIKRVGFSLIRVHRYQTFYLTNEQDDKLVDQLRWPTETLYWGAQPTSYVNTQDNWNKYHVSINNAITYPVRIPSGLPFPFPPDQLAFADASYETPAPIFNEVGFRIQAIQLFLETPVSFYNTYLPMTYGGNNISSPTDIGAYITTFNLYPGSYQPSGHINLSKSREFYFSYISNYISKTNPCYLTIYAICLNFLLLSAGACVLRYNT
jgi:hypothetical protein